MEESITVQDNSQLIYLFTIGVLVTAMLLEAFAPRRKLESGLAWRWVNNFSLGLVTWYLTTVITTLFLVWLARQTEINQYGLFQHLDTHWLIPFIALLTVSQLIDYALHIVFHKVSWLWPIHAIHHLDTDVDVSTSYRTHPLQLLVILPLVAPLVLLLGIPPEAALAYQLFHAAMNVFSHSNLHLPSWLDVPLRKVIVTPDFHRLHHCSDRRYTDSNYGNSVPWFDYLFGTATWRPPEQQPTMKLGLQYLRAPGDSRIDRLLVLPFTWRAKIARYHSMRDRAVQSGKEPGETR